MPQRLLFIKPSNSTFIRKDEAFLAARYDVTCFWYHYGNGVRHLISSTALAVWLLIHLSRANAVFVWFADYHSWLPIILARQFGKKSLLVLGGYDVACVPELNYGVFVRPFRGWCARRSIRNAHHVLPVTRAMLPDIQKQVGRITGALTIVPTGYSSQVWFPSGSKDEKMILSVAFGHDLARLKIKGLDLFADTAQELPDYHFVIIGLQGEARHFLERRRIANLELLGPLSIELLRGFYQKANIYMQLSLREGLPNAVLEAMLCECIPVGSPVGGIPEAMGTAGFLIEERTTASVARILQKAVAQAPLMRTQARLYSQTHFSETLRQETLSKIIDQSPIIGH
jgi:glycosyltransferase involved in cell wall biosynthesis